MRLKRRRWWTRLVTVAAVLVVLAATISVLFRLAVEAVPGYRVELEAAVAQAAGRPARVGGIALTWHGLRPTLTLQDVALLDAAGGKPLLEARRLDLGVAFAPLLRGRLRLARVEAAGIALDADIDRDGHWRLRGFDAAAGGGDTARLEDLERLASVRVVDSELRLHDARLADAEPLRLRLRSATLRRDGERYVLVGALDPPAGIARRADFRIALAGTLAEPAGWRGDWQLGIEDLQGWPWLVARLEPGTTLAIERGRLALGGRIEQGQPTGATLDLQLGALQARQGRRLRAGVADLALRATASLDGDGAWTLSIDRFALSGARGAWEAGAARLRRDADAAGGGLHAEVASLRLDDLAPWLALLRDLPPAAARLAGLHGDIADLRLDAMAPADAAATPPTLALSAHLHGLGLAAGAGQAGFDGLEARVDGSLAQGRLVLDGEPLRILLPDLFEQPVAVESLRGELAWQRLGDDWQLAAGGLDLRLLGAGAQGEASLLLPGTAGALSQLKVDLALNSTDAATLKPLMPLDWGAETRAWLSRALLHARVAKGRLLIDTPITPRADDGRPTMPWRLDLEVDQAALDYAPEWPSLSGLAAQLRFHDGGLDIEAGSAAIGAVKVRRLRAAIPDLHVPALVIDAGLAGDGAEFYRLLRTTPLHGRLGGLLRNTEAAGPLDADLHLNVPLDAAEPEVAASGEVRFDDARLVVHGLDQPLTALRGRLRFGADGVVADLLQARAYDTDVLARIHGEPGSPDGVLLGEFAFAPGAGGGLAEAFLPDWLRTRLGGQATMRLRLPFAGGDGGRLTLTSDLRGVTSNLPPPLAKRADAALPLTVAIAGDEQAPLRVRIAAGDALRTTLRFAEAGGTLKTRGVELRLGAGDMPDAASDGLVVGGAPEQLDLAAWGALVAAAQAGPGDLPFVLADLRPQRLAYERYALGPTHLVATPAPEQALHVVLDGAAEGAVDWHARDGGLVSVRLQRAAFEALPPLPPLPPAGAEAAPEPPFEPGLAPTLDIDCANLSLGDVALGHLNLVTSRVPDGQRIERLRLDGGRLVLGAEGQWLRGGDGERSSGAELSFDLASSAIGDVLRVFGYAPSVSAETVGFSGRVHWPRRIEGLELSQAEGEIRLEAKRGSLKAVDPLAGRVLGLMNLYALPRRLLLDFRDVVSAGLSFDRLQGHFTLAGGDAETRDLELVGPQAKILLEGRIGLAARDYDQKVTVTPDISTSVTVGATLIGGPIGGGVALIAQQLFGKPFNRLARFSYRVTGSWDNPEVIKGEASEPPTAAPDANSDTKPDKNLDAPPAEPSATGVRHG